jgi:RNA polymerase sigma-70 factor (ECF subfamily)
LVAILRDALLDVPRLSAVDAGRAADVEPRRARVAALYASHGARIFRFLRDLLGEATLAADATQETFVRAFRQLDAFDAARPPLPWLLGIARNVSLEVRRARTRRERVIVPGVGDVDAEAGPGSPESELLGREAVRVVAAALARLSEDRRAMLLLRLDHGLAYEDIASLMGFSLAKVKVEIFRAREILRATLADYEGGAR